MRVALVVTADMNQAVSAIGGVQQKLQQLGPAAAQAGATASAGLDRVAPAAQRATQELQKTGAAAAEVTRQTRLTSHQLGMLGQQASDVAVTLAGGMNPLMVLLQQGPQITYAVGGIGNAFSLLAQALSPLRVAALGVTGVLLGSAIAFEGQQRSLNELSNRLRVTRGDYQELSRAVDQAARAVAASSSLGTGEARQAGQTIAGSVNFQGDQRTIRESIDLARRLAAVYGTDVPEAAERLRQALDRPAEAARRLADEGLRTMDEGLVRTITRLEQQGRVIEAGRLVLDAYNRAAGEVARTPLQQAISGLSQAFNSLWQAVQPVVEWIGTHLIRAISQAVNLISVMVNGIRSLIGGVGELMGMGGAEPAMAGAAAGGAATFSGANRALGGSRNAQRNAYQDAIRRMREDISIASFSTGSQRQAMAELAQVLRPMRDQGQSWTDGQVAEVLGLINERQGVDLGVRLTEMDRARAATEAQTRALGEGMRASDDARIAAEAHAEVLARYGANAEDVERRTRNLTQALIQERDAQAALAAARENASARERIELRRSTIGMTAGERAMAEAEARTRGMLRVGLRDNLNPEQQGQVDGARRLAALGVEVDRQAASWNELGRLGEQAFDRIGEAITQGTLDLKNLSRIGQSVASELLQAFMRLAFINPIMNAVFGQNRGTMSDLMGGGGGGLIGALAGGIGSLFGGGFLSGAGTTGAAAGFPLMNNIFHTGGIVGADSVPTRITDASLFAGAPRFHSGAILASDEVPAILQKGEGVFTAEQMARLGPAGGVEVHVPITFHGDAGRPEDREMLVSMVDQRVQMAVARAAPGIVNASYSAVMSDVTGNGKLAGRLRR
jgi:hypothetical protein